MPQDFSRGDIQRALVSTSATATLVAAVPGQRIILISYMLVSAGTVAVTWTSHVTGALSGAMPMVVNGVLQGSYNPTGHIATVVGEALDLTLGASIAVTGYITYIVEPG